ncbi:hypothetical protein SEPCBS57363_006384 [Sporothrix epigloea]|uniref:Purple acid phosphatase n=1 Tax=Sporothrix epigloea TaxID=1892477 RepID=A0ABP0E2R8_9PEZI
MRISTTLLAFVGTATASVIINNSSVTSQVRVAFNGDNGMVVSWNTFDQLSNPTVLYGLSADSLTLSASSDVSVTYPTSLTYNNHVLIKGLLPDTTYYYQPQHLLANETVYGPYTFKTARPAGDLTPYSIAFVCDLGTMGSGTLGLTDIHNKKTDTNEELKPGEKNTVDSLAALMDTYEFIVHPGDIAYSDYFLKEELAGYINATLEEGPQVYETILNEFYDEMESVTAFRPYMIGVGNHEADCDNGGSGKYDGSICVQGQTNFTGVTNHFRMPSDRSGGVANFWYSFDYGMVHYVFFNTETDLGNGLLNDEQSPFFAGPFGSYVNEQVDWLEADLASVDRCRTPWVIALGHRPWFTSGDSCPNCSVAFSQMFENHGVDLVLQGHFHVYERNVPVFTNGTIDPAGYENPSAPWYLINGIAGHWGGMDSFAQPVANFQAYGLDDSNAVYGWSRLHFYNATHLQHEFVASNNNSVLDTTLFYKEHVCNAVKPLSSSTIPLSTSSSASASASSASVSASFISCSELASSSSELASSSSLPSVSGSASVSAPTSSSSTSSVSSSGSVSAIASSSVSARSSGSAVSVSTSAESSVSQSTKSSASALASASAVSSGSVSGSASASVSASAIGSATGSASESASISSSSAASYITSTILSTHTYTITSCAPTITNCPVGHVTTEVLTLFTTWCPVTATEQTGAGVTTGAGAVTSVPVVSYPSSYLNSTSTSAGSNSYLGSNAGSGSSSGSGTTTGKIATSTGFSSGSNSGFNSGSGSASSSGSGSGSSAAAGSGSTVVTAGSANMAISMSSLILAVVVGAVALL